MKAFLLVLMIFLSSNISLFGQIYLKSESTHYIGYSLGAGQIKEENLIPKTHKGLSHFLSYQFEFKNDVYRCFEFIIGFGRYKTKIENETLSFNVQLLLSYLYNFKIFENEYIDYYLGLKTGFASSLSEYENWDEAHAYWGNYLSLGPSNTVNISLDENNYLLMHLDLALLGIYTRPDYNRLYANEHWTFSNIINKMNSNYHFGFVNNAFQAKASVEYRTPIFNDDHLSLMFSFYYSRLQADSGKPLKEFFIKFGIGIWL